MLARRAAGGDHKRVRSCRPFLLSRPAPRRRSPEQGRGAIAGLLRDERATATVEFALVFPLLLAFALILAQTAMLVTGNLYVHYAATSAARVASLHVPRELRAVSGEPINVIRLGTRSPKFDAVTRAAVVAVAPAAGRIDAAGSAYGGVPEALATYYESSGADAPRWVDTRVAEKFAYAQAHTAVELGRIDDRGRFTPVRGWVRFGPREAIGVRVRHRLHLGVPYAGLLFHDATHTTSTGETPYVEVVGRAVAINRGVDPALPPPPPIPRTP